MIGGTSRGVDEGLTEVAVDGRDCKIGLEVESSVTGEEGVTSDPSEEVCGVSCPCSVVAEVVLLLASSFRETPRSCWISSGFRPFDSRNEILRSVGESRIDSSSRKRDAWSRRSCRVEAGASELGDGDEAGWSASAFPEPDCCCQEGIEGGLDVGSDMVPVLSLDHRRERGMNVAN